MDSLFSHPHFVPLVIGVAATIIGTIVIALAIKSWTKLKHLPPALLNHLLNLAKNLDPPTIIKKSKLDSLIAASKEIEILQFKVVYQTELYQQLEIRTKRHEDALRKEINHLKKVTAERNDLRRLDNQPKNEMAREPVGRRGVVGTRASNSDPSVHFTDQESGRGTMVDNKGVRIGVYWRDDASVQWHGKLEFENEEIKKWGFRTAKEVKEWALGELRSRRSK